jgi:hypothetical protein
VQGTVQRPATSGLLAIRLACSQFVVGSAESVHFAMYKTGLLIGLRSNLSTKYFPTPCC